MVSVAVTPRSPGEAIVELGPGVAIDLTARAAKQDSVEQDELDDPEGGE